MTATITVKLSADNRTELINTFGSEAEQYRTHIEKLRQAGAFGQPDKVNVRFLLIGGRHEGLDVASPLVEPEKS